MSPESTHTMDQANQEQLRTNAVAAVTRILTQFGWEVEDLDGEHFGLKMVTLDGAEANVSMTIALTEGQFTTQEN